MPSVEQALRALRREILAGWSGEAGSAPGDGWSVDRMTLSLGVRPRSGDGAGGWEVHPGPDPAPHRLTVELSRPGLAEPGGTDGPPALGPGPEEPACLEGLAEVFGAPGFDSAARATVFRETLEPLEESERRRVLASLGGAAGVPLEPSLGLARHLVLRLAGSGPSGAKEGPVRLSRLAERFPPSQLIRVAAERWRTQSEWAASADRGAVERA